MTVDVNLDTLARADTHRVTLREIVGDIVVASETLESASTTALRQIGERLDTSTFRVMIVGEFKRGKSTLVNAILGTDVLPSYSRPCTAVVTEVRWADSPEATLHPADGSPEIEVPVEKLNERITIAPGAKQGTEDASPWRLAVVGWPLELCRNRVTLIDSPGLNEHPIRQEVTLDYLRHADAIVFVQDCQNAVSMEEVKFIQTYLDAYDLFFVFNKINIINAEERPDLMANIIERTQLCRDGQRNDKYYFVNALGAVQARSSGDQEGWRESGVAAFVDDLNTYLLEERHRAKILVTARDIRRVHKGLRDQLPELRALIDGDAAKLQQRYDEAETPLLNLEKRARQIRQVMDQRISSLQDDIRINVSQKMVQLSDEVPAIVDETIPDAELSLVPWKVKKSAEWFAESTATKTSDEISDRFGVWAREYLAPRISDAVQAMAKETDDVVNEFLDDLQKVRERLTGVEHTESKGAESIFEEVIERVSPGGFSDISGAHAGAGISHILQQLLATMGVMTLWVFTPFGLIPLIIGVLAANAGVLGMAKGRLEKKVKKEIAAEISREIRSNSGENSENVAMKVSDELRPISAEIMATVEGRVAELRSQVESALEMLKHGTGDVEKRRADLDRAEAALDDTGDRIQDLLADLAEL